LFIRAVKESCADMERNIHSFGYSICRTTIAFDTPYWRTKYAWRGGLGEQLKLVEGAMGDRRYDAMRHAVALALSGRYNNWWSVMARLRARQYREADVVWSESQRMWLDQLCGEAKLMMQGQDAAPRRALPEVIEGGRRRGGPLEGRPRQILELRTPGGRLNHR
jgi:hypothetical protein